MMFTLQNVHKIVLRIFKICPFDKSKMFITLKNVETCKNVYENVKKNLTQLLQNFHGV